jgi:hypothetical protein
VLVYGVLALAAFAGWVYAAMYFGPLGLLAYVLLVGGLIYAAIPSPRRGYRPGRNARSFRP